MELFIIITLLIIAAETSYLSLKTVRKSQRLALAPVFVDTSVLIDGRIISVAESGFITRPLYIPRSVVGELQLLADTADSEKRVRARHGLDIINQLQSMTNITTHIFSDSVRAEEGVDNRLLALAKKHGGALCTIDYNLNKVAVVEGIEVLNINELAKTLRMAYLPGERLNIELTQKGNDQHQAIGHLGDGTMVVVEHANKQIGTVAEVEFIRGLQTAAGKMMFAKLVRPQQSTHSQQQKQPQKRKMAQPAKATKPVTPEASKLAPEPTPTLKASPKGAKPVKRQQQRRRSPEDSLVELANK